MTDNKHVSADIMAAALKLADKITDEEITLAARVICYDQASKADRPEISLYMSGAWDHTVWMRLVEQGIRKGLEQST